MKSDKHVQQDIIEELKWEPLVNGAQIGVEVRDGIVTLSGQVNSHEEKRHAELAAQRVPGVKALTIEIDIALPDLGKRNNDEIALLAVNVLEWIVNMAGTDVKVIVENGWVTLAGEVAWEYQKQAALEEILRLDGVLGVSDEITIKPKVPLHLLTEDIEVALWQRAKADAMDISAEILNAKSKLLGVTLPHPFT